MHLHECNAKREGPRTNFKVCKWLEERNALLMNIVYYEIHGCIMQRVR